MINYIEHPPVGIDLGTTNSVLSQYINTRIKPQCTNVYRLNTTGHKNNDHLFPSYVINDEEKQLKAGLVAYNQRINKPKQVAKAIKRKIDINDKVFELNGEKFTPVDLLTVIAKDIFTDPLLQEHNLCPAGVVLTVPYYFGQQQNINTLTAVENALSELYGDNKPEILSVFPEPIAAALTYVHENISNIVNQRKGVVFDLGGGTLDVTFFTLNISMSNISFEVLGSTGIANMGGEDFDKEIEKLIIKEERLNFSDLPEQRRLAQLRMMREQIILAKESLSSPNIDSAEIIFQKLSDGSFVEFQLTQSRFEDLLLGTETSKRNYMTEINEVIDISLAELELDGAMFDLFLCVGGSSQIPIIKNWLSNKFPNASFSDSQDLTFSGVSKGAALYAAYLLDKKYNQNHKPFGRNVENVEIIYRTTHSLGVEMHDNSMHIILPKGTKIPCKKDVILFPTIKNDYNDTASVDHVKILQGYNKQIIGELPIPNIHLHGRNINKNEVPIKISYKYDDTILKVTIHVPKGNEDRSDINIYEVISLKV